MGMNLYPKGHAAEPANEALADDLCYNWNRWGTLITYLEKWGVNTDEFKQVNDGDLISNETCLAVAYALNRHLEELPPAHRDWLAGHDDEWLRLSAHGGAEQH